MGTRPRKIDLSKKPNKMELHCCAEWGDLARHPRFVRLISKGGWESEEAADAIRLAGPWCTAFQSLWLVTHGGFGVATADSSASEKELWTAADAYLRRLLAMLPPSRDFNLVFGLDVNQGQEVGRLQNAYYIPRAAETINDLKCAHKCYPRSDETRRVVTRGIPCPDRATRVGSSTMNLLVCHDAVAFSGRGEATRGHERDGWAAILMKETVVTEDSFVVHLIHYLDQPGEGKVFTNARRRLAGCTSVLSSFGTQLNPFEDWSNLNRIQYSTAESAGPTLDLFVLRTDE